MKKSITVSLLLVSFCFTLAASPRISFKDLLVNAELNFNVLNNAESEAISRGLPVNVITTSGLMIDAKGIEDGKIVYAVITDFADIYKGCYTAFYEEVSLIYDPLHARINYGNGNIKDNTGGICDPVFTRLMSADRFVMIPEWTDDKIYLFDAQTGDLVDANFILPVAQLQNPKQSLLHFSGRYILVSDPLSRIVHKFDTSGVYIGIFAPSGGPNPAIIDNLRGITYLPNRDLLVTVGNGPNNNTVQRFDSGGVHLGTFCGTGINSPFDVLIRGSDVLVTNSTGTNRITKYDLNGTFLSNFYTGSSFTFPEQIIRLPNGMIVCAAFSPPATSGVAVLDSAGNFVKIMQAVTGNRGVYLLGNGHYLTTNGTGVHEIDSSTGNLIRTVAVASNFQYITPYNPGVLLSTGIANTVPKEYGLFQNYPNPFNPSTKIKYQIPAGGFVKISVYDLTAREVVVLVNEFRSAGEHEINFSAEGLSSGMYFYKLESGEYSEYKKMVLIK
jgi:hypothetical protein